MPVAIGSEFGSKLREVLGLPKMTREIKLHIPVDDLVTVEAEYIPELAGKEDEFLELVGIAGMQVDEVKVVIKGTLLVNDPISATEL
jgi:hypothetical protein